MAELRRINHGPDGYKVFQVAWPSLHSRLLRESENGAFNSLTKERWSQLWWEIEFMRACAHPAIFKNHSAEIIPILFSFDLPEQNQELREVLVGSAQL